MTIYKKYVLIGALVFFSSIVVYAQEGRFKFFTIGVTPITLTPDIIENDDLGFYNIPSFSMSLEVLDDGGFGSAISFVKGGITIEAEDLYVDGTNIESFKISKFNLTYALVQRFQINNKLDFLIRFGLVGSLGTQKFIENPDGQIFKASLFDFGLYSSQGLSYRISQNIYVELGLVQNWLFVYGTTHYFNTGVGLFF